MPPLAKTSMNDYSRALHLKKRGKHCITWLCNNHHNRVSLRDLVKSAPIAGHKWYWFHKDDTYGRTDTVDKTTIIVIELYRKHPPANSYTTRHPYPHAPSSPITNTNKPMYGKLRENHTPLPGLMEATRTSKATQQTAEDDGNAQRRKQNHILLTNGIGIVANWCLLLDDTKTTQPTPQGSDPSAFQYLPAPTDRQRKAQVPSIAEMDIQIQALYWKIIGSQWLIPRTLDPTHIPSTTTSSSWVGLLKHPTRLKIHEIRKARPPHIPIYSHGITQTLRDSMYHVQQDALAMGPRCGKKGVTRSLCDLCWYLNGQRQEETTKHILFDCPHAASVLNTKRSPSLHPRHRLDTRRSQRTMYGQSLFHKKKFPPHSLWQHHRRGPNVPRPSISISPFYRGCSPNCHRTSQT